jgi:Family of unknown function (DUF5906)
MSNNIGVVNNYVTPSVPEETEVNENSSKTITYSYNPAILPGMDKDEAGHKSYGWRLDTCAWDKVKIEEMIRTRAYLASDVKDGHRTKSNVKNIFNIILDFDSGHPSLKDFLILANDYQFCWIAHTTVNHQKDKVDKESGIPIPNSAKDKFRVIIPLKEPIQESDLEAVAKYWCSTKRFPTLDPTSFQGSRYYMVNPNAEVFIHDRAEADTEELYDFLDPFAAGIIPKNKRNRAKRVKKAQTFVQNKAELIEKGKFHYYVPELVVTTLKGDDEFVQDIEDKTQIFCPFCDPSKRQHPDKDNAFVDFNKTGQQFIYCSSEHKTYWANETTEAIEEKCERFWSYNTSVYEAGMISDVFSLENISEKKFYVKVGAVTKETKQEYYDHLVTNKHLHRLNRIDNTGDISVDESTFEFNQTSGNIKVKIKALSAKIEDNDFIELYLDNVFGQHKDFIKQWLAVYAYTNYTKLPTLILTGDRGVGKNTFAESVLAIFPALSEIAKDLHNNFTPFAEKKLLIIDESASNGKLQYQMLKKFSGQKYLEVNKKYLPQYQVLNNINIIFLSNDELPIYVERDEIPTDTRNNQFFVYHMKPHTDFDANLQDKIIARLGYWVRSELKIVYDSLKLDNYRYAIDVPITPEELKLFNNSVTDIEAEADRIIEYIETHIGDPTWWCIKFAQNGILPTSFFNDTIQNPRVSKVKVIQNLQKRGYITNDRAERYEQIDNQRPYAYKLGEKVSVPIKPNSHMDSHTDTFQLAFTEAS